MKIAILSIACMIMSSFAVQAQIPQVTINSTVTDNDVDMTLFLNYIDRNDNCRALDVTLVIPLAGGVYDVNTIAANGWWASGGTPNLNPADMKAGTSPFFSGVQISHTCEVGSYSPNFCPNVDVLRVWDYPYFTTCSPASNLTDCLEYSTGCGGSGPCIAGTLINATWSGGVNATLNVTH